MWTSVGAFRAGCIGVLFKVEIQGPSPKLWELVERPRALELMVMPVKLVARSGEGRQGTEWPHSAIMPRLGRPWPPSVVPEKWTET